MPQPTPLPPGLGSEFSVARAYELGITRRRTRARDLTSPFRGVRSSVPPESHVEWCAAYLPRLAPGQFFTHLSAAAIWGMPLRRQHQRGGPVHIGVVAPGSPPRAVGVVGHVLPVGSVIRTRGGIPVLDAATTWSYLGTSLTHEELVAAGDFLVRKKAPLSRMPGLSFAASAAHRSGIRAVRAALAEVRPKTESPKETELRLAIVGAGLPEPLVGYTVRDAKGDFVATPDLAYERERIAIEYEGQQHFADPRVYQEDILRYELLEEAGWLVIRVIHADLGARRRLLVTRIARALARRR